jgi:hypothetical protein
MSSERLTQELISLPLAERVAIAEALWLSIHESIDLLKPNGEEQVLLEAQRRDQDLVSGGVTGRSHKDVMEAARQALQCG